MYNIFQRLGLDRVPLAFVNSCRTAVFYQRLGHVQAKVRKTRNAAAGKSVDVLDAEVDDLMNTGEG